MTDEEKQRAAQAILSVPYFNALWDEIEQAAINACINAEYTDHEKRQAMAAEVRAIRKVRDRLKSISEQSAQPRRSAPA